MADTQRDALTLQGLLGDNVVGAITPQVLRDLLVSAFGGYGWIYVENGGAAQTVNTAAAKLTAFVNNGAPSNGPIPDNANDYLTVPVAGDYMAEFSASFSGTASRTFQLQLRKNGLAVPGVRCRTKLNGTGDVTEVSFVGLVTCAANDQLSVFAAADVDGSSITVVDAALALKRVG